MKWFFRDKTPVHPDWKIVDINQKNGSALAISPRGKKPRVYTMERIRFLDSAGQHKIDETHRKTLEITLDEVPELSEALTKVFFYKLSGNTVDHPLANFRYSKILDVADNKWRWSQKRAEYLLCLLSQYENLLMTDILTVDETTAMPDKNTVTGIIVEKSTYPSIYGDGYYTKVLIKSDCMLYHGGLPTQLEDKELGDEVSFRAVIRFDQKIRYASYNRPRCV